jgi:hypothetical protein
MGSNAEYAEMSLEAGWDYGFRSTEKPRRPDVAMIDVDWQKPDIRRHVDAVAEHRPWIAVCPDVTAADQWEERIKLAYELHRVGARNVMMVPKVTPWHLPEEPWIVLGYPVGVGEGSVCPFETMATDWPMHLLGGTITGQLRAMLHFHAGRVISGDQSAHTKAARFGDRYHEGGRRIQSAVMPPGMTGRERMLRDVRDSFFGIRACWNRQAVDVSPRFIPMLLDFPEET